MQQKWWHYRRVAAQLGSPFVRKCERTDNGLQNLTLLERRLPPKGRRFDIVHELPLPQYGSTAVDTQEPVAPGL